MGTAWLRPLLEALLGAVAALLAVTERSARLDRPSRARRAAWSAVASPASRRCLLPDDGVDDETRAALAAAWNHEASVAHGALVRSTQRALELASLGAPPSLVARAHEDALDDIRRAKLCSAIARGMNGQSVPPAGSAARRPLLRARSGALASLAAGVVVDVALAHGRASRMHAKLARRTIDRTIRAALEEIAASEARHVAHAWAIVRWCIAEKAGGAVEHALRGLVGRLPAPRGFLPCEALDGGWERWGIAGAALERQAHADACERVERNIHELVSSMSGRGRLAAA